MPSSRASESGCDEQGPPLAAELQDQLLHDENAFGVESAKRFVEQQDPFALHQQQDQRQPFPLVGRHGGCFGGGRYGSRRSNGAGSDAGW